MSFAISGVFCAAVTPLNADLSPDLGRYTAHCRNLLETGCHGLALLGTTGEANSFSTTERKTILEAPRSNPASAATSSCPAPALPRFPKPWSSPSTPSPTA